MPTVKRIPRPEFKDILNKVKASKLEAQIGWFDTARYEDGTPVAYIATIQEYGYPQGGIPPRSFVRSTIAEKSKDWKEIMRKNARDILYGKKSPAQVLELVALAAEGDIRKTITKITSPALAISTLDARWRRGNGSDKPLVDSGLMLATLTSVVVEKK